ncbi:hypothetical protein Rs2_14927 [Raphanus sativus]|nr:hypothetical protein Rs2_14927 [Raphanus sativus]
MFHNVTYWYSAYVSSRITGSSTLPLESLVSLIVHTLFSLMDTARYTPLLDAARRNMVSFVFRDQIHKELTKPVCFRHTILSPLGYETALLKGLSGEIDCNGESAHSLWLDPDNTKTVMLSKVVSLLKCLC